MGNRGSKSASSESMDPCQRTSIPSSSTPVGSVLPSPPAEIEEEIDPEQIRPSKRLKSSESMNSCHHGSTPSSPPAMETFQLSPADSVHPSLPMDASIESIRETYEKTNSAEQIDRLIRFVQNQLIKMNTPSEVGSSHSSLEVGSSHCLLETVEESTDLAARTIVTISTEAEKLSQSGNAMQKMGMLTLKVMRGLRELHWIFLGLSAAAFAVKIYMNAPSTEKEECRKLLLKILELARDLTQYSERMHEDSGKLCEAVRTIVEGALMCRDYMERKKFSRFWSATTAAAQLQKTKQQLRNVRISLVYGGENDVFLSHSGSQKNFVRQLHLDLTRKGISCFFDEDDKSLPLGQEFPPLIFKAAETCKIAVLVLSEDFICSKWPMLELSAFIRAIKSKTNANLMILPIFYMIRPEELDSPKWQTEWQKLKIISADSDRDIWQDALNEVRKMKGLPLDKNGNEVDCRYKVVKRICEHLNVINIKLLDFQPVGIEQQVREVKALLEMERAQSALAVIVCGFGGVGKTTLAASVVESLDWSSTDFKFCMVAIDEKKTDKTSHIIELQKFIISKFGGCKLDFQNPLQGRRNIQETLENKCSLLFIDNVVDKDYIKDLLPKNLSSSEQKTQIDAEKQKTKLRILITSRHKNVIGELNIMCKVHEMESLCESASQQLLSQTILKRKVAENKDFDEKRMINEVAHACRGVPLLLSVFGKHLKMERDKDSYEEALDVLRKGNLDSYREEDLGKTVMFLYHKIKDDEVKEAFLDICTYFQGWEWNLVADIVDSSNLRDLQRRMLVSRSGSGEVIVHDILRLMGMQMGSSARFSNLDNLDGFENVKDVKGLSLVKEDTSIIIQSTQLEAMSQSLRVLMLGDWVALGGPPSNEAFTKLRYLRVGDITTFPFKDPSKLNNLRVFQNRSKPGMNLYHLPSSLKHISHEVPDVECDKFVKLPFQNLSSLKSFIVKARKEKPVELPEELHLPASLVDLDLNTCKNLPKDIGHLTALESFILDRSDVERLPQGFGKLKKLKHLSMDYCSELAILSQEFGMLSSLEAFSMKNCRNLRVLPESLGGLVSLQTLELTKSNLQLLPESFGGLSSLQTLDLEGSINLQLLPESFGELRIHSLKLHSLVKLRDLPNGFGNLPLLKDLSLESCESLMSLPNSFVQLKMLETLNIIECTKLSVLPENFCQLRCLKHMTVLQCHLLKELPRGFGALPALKTFSLESCDSFVNLPRDFGELTSLESFSLWTLPLMSRIPDGFGKLRKLRYLNLNFCFQLKTLSDDFENMASLERLNITECPELDGAMMEKILKLQNCYAASIDGSRKLTKKWEHMRAETEHPIAVLCRWGMRDEEERGCALMVALLHGKCMEVKNPSEQLMERSSLLVGLEEGKSAIVALIMLPILIEAHQQKTLLRFVEMARKTAKANGSAQLQIVCATIVDLEAERPTPTEEEERAKEERIRQILLLLPTGSAAIPSTESKRLKILTFCCDSSSIDRDELSFFMATVVVVEGRKRFENLKFTREYEMREHPPSEIREPKSIHYNSVSIHSNSIQNFIESIPDRCQFGLRSVWVRSEWVAGESKTRELMEALKGSGIDYLLIENNTSKMAVHDLDGKKIGFIFCDLETLKCIKLEQIYKDLQQKDSNFIAMWIPIKWPEGCGHATYTRAIQCMPWATFPPPPPPLVGFTGETRFVILDEDGHIADPDALPLLLGWVVEFYPPAQRNISEIFCLMESESCLEFLLHGMNIVGRKSMGSKMTFLYKDQPRLHTERKLERKSKLEELTQIHGSFEVLFVGSEPNIRGDYFVKQEYEDAIQDMRWPSLSFSDMLMFWNRCLYLRRMKQYKLNKESNIITERLCGFVQQLSWWDWLVLVDKDGVVTRRGYDAVQMICEPWDEMSEAERMVKEELMRGECGALVKTFFADEIHNLPQHPQHPVRYSTSIGKIACNVCDKSFRFDGVRWNTCGLCRWQMCVSCWRVSAKQQVEQLLLAKDN